MDSIVTLKRFKETKNFFVFTDPTGIIINPVYVKKDAFKGLIPDKIELVYEPD